MFHKKREWSVKHVESVEELARLLGNYSWTGCTGFEVEGFLFLNDATSGDGAQEFGVLRAEDLVQVESWTASWAFEECLRSTRRDGVNDDEAATMAFAQKLKGLLARVRGEAVPLALPEGPVVVATSAGELAAALGTTPRTFASGITRRQLKAAGEHGACSLCA